MPTATKNSRPKNKKTSSLKTEKVVDDGSEVLPIKISKAVPIIDELDPVVAIDEKTEEDPLVGVVEEDDGLEDVGIDELNPFGDRWEE